jgi:ABC-type arginine/histidine transport system permease subunit
MPSVRSSADLPWVFLMIVTVSVIAAGLIALLLAVKNIKGNTIVSALRKE